MTITQLKYVLAAEHKNFTLAAEKMFSSHDIKYADSKMRGD
jgi:hypothetical protein